MVEEVKSAVAYECTDVNFVPGSDYCNPCNNYCD